MTRDKLITIIPAKPFTEAKTRLATILSPQQRRSLSRALLKRSIALARQIGPVVVVSRSKEVRLTAHKWGAATVAEESFQLSAVSGQRSAVRLHPSSFALHPSEDVSLNAAIRQGLEYVLTTGAKSALILPLDLPLLSLADLQNLLALSGTDAPALVIAPCQRNKGTNALLLRPPTLIAPRFGENSFSAHLLAARAVGVTPKICRAPGFQYDLDSPDDWHQLVERKKRLPGEVPNDFDALFAFR